MEKNTLAILGLLKWQNDQLMLSLMECALAEERVRELHRPDCGAETRFCRCCAMAWPCGTLRALTTPTEPTKG